MALKLHWITESDYDRLAGATVAGHLIECGTQVTGGISSDWLWVPDPAHIGFPIVEIDGDGSCVVTKHANTGGRVDQWVDAQTLLAEFEHPLWREIAERAQGAGHGGMDYIEDYRLIKCLREGLPLDMTVYDAAALSAIVDLSVRSVRREAEPVPVPDFTRGRWRTTPPLPILRA